LRTAFNCGAAAVHLRATIWSWAAAVTGFAAFNCRAAAVARFTAFNCGAATIAGFAAFDLGTAAVTFDRGRAASVAGTLGTCGKVEGIPALCLVEGVFVDSIARDKFVSGMNASNWCTVIVSVGVRVIAWANVYNTMSGRASASCAWEWIWARHQSVFAANHWIACVYRAGIAIIAALARVHAALCIVAFANYTQIVCGGCAVYWRSIATIVGKVALLVPALASIRALVVKELAAVGGIACVGSAWIVIVAGLVAIIAAHSSDACIDRAFVVVIAYVSCVNATLIRVTIIISARILIVAVLWHLATATVLVAGRHVALVSGHAWHCDVLAAILAVA
jgi:hypothetical protein